MAEYSLKAVFGLDATGLKTGLKQVRSEVNDLVTQWGKWAALAGAAAFTALAKGAVDLAGRLSDTAQNIGINVEALQALQAQHKRNGVSEEQLQKALEKTKNAVIDAANGNKKAAESLEVLGLSAAKLIRLPLAEQYAAIGKAAAKAKDQNAAYNAVTELFGEKIGPKMMGSLKELGEIGLPGVTKAAKEAGQVMSNETIAALDRAGDAIDDFKKRATIAVGNIIVNFRTEEGFKLMGLELLRVTSVWLAKIIQVPLNVGQVMAATLTGAFEAATGYLRNAGIEAVKKIATAINAVLPERFEINIGNLDQFKSDSKGFVDDIARNIALTKPTAFVDAVSGAYDELIEKQRAVVEALNKADLKPATEALTNAGKAAAQPIKESAADVAIAGAKAGDSIASAATTLAKEMHGIIAGIRGGAQFNTASDEALQEIVARNRQQAQRITNPALTSGAQFNTGEAARLQLEAQNAQNELNMRAGVRSAFAQGGEQGVFQAYKNTDPLILEKMIDQFARNLTESQRTVASLDTIKNGLIARGIIPRT